MLVKKVEGKGVEVVSLRGVALCRGKEESRYAYNGFPHQELQRDFEAGQFFEFAKVHIGRLVPVGLEISCREGQRLQRSARVVESS